MIFNTLVFAKFILVVFTGSWALSRWPKARFIFLAIASYIFYAGLDVFSSAFHTSLRTMGPWDALVANAKHLASVPIVFVGSTVDYWLSIWIDRTEDPKKRKALLLVTIVMNAGLLLVFKYWDFLAEQVIALGGPDGRLHIAMPLGISFFTFMSLSFVVDVYRREIPACRDYAHYVTYIAFFPHLVAGPIIRGKDLLPQFAKPVVLTATAAGEGIFLVCVGLFKKVVISDYLSKNLVDRIVEAPTSYSSVEVLVGMFAYAVQIYCDFSGYSDVAIGIALLLGYRLKINFDAPFKSSNLVEFWRRWHISLSSWLRDYIYIPLGGSRAPQKTDPSPGRARLAAIVVAVGGVSFLVNGYLDVAHAGTGDTRSGALFLLSAAVMLAGLMMAGAGRKYRNVWITMVVCGIWHGAAWSYVLFGVIQGLAVGISHFWFDSRGKRASDAGDAGVSLGKLPFVLLTFLFTTFTFVLIRAPLDKAVLMYRQLFAFSTFAPNVSAKIVALIALGLVVQWLPRDLYNRVREAFTRAPAPVQGALLFMIAIVLRDFDSGESVPFVYGGF
jgi:alginate O-acetyltransferase complex protein AlgI